MVRKNLLCQWENTEKEDSKWEFALNTGQAKASEKTDRKPNPMGAILDLVQVLGSESTIQ